MSTMAINLGYLHGRPLPYLGCNNYSRDSTGGYTVLLILKSWGFRLIFKLNLSDFNHRYSLTTID